MLVPPGCYRSVIPPPPFPDARVFFYPINSGRRALVGYECRTPSLIVVLPPSHLLLASLAHVGIVDFCVYTYFTDRRRADDIWPIVVGFYRSLF